MPLDATDQAALTTQLSQALQAAERYPTVASAKAAGMILAGGMAPGVGAHYQLINAEAFKGINPDGTINPAYPASWIYASTANNAPVVGVMYESLAADGAVGVHRAQRPLAPPLQRLRAVQQREDRRAVRRRPERHARRSAQTCTVIS